MDDLDNWYGYWSGWVYILLEEGKQIEEIQGHLDAIAKKNNSAITNPDEQRAVKYKTQALIPLLQAP